MSDLTPENQDDDSSDYEPPTYRGGHYDTSLKDFPLRLDMPMFKTGWIPVGDDPEGPAVAIAVNPPGMPVDGPPHFHNTASVRMIIEGSMKIGPNWYRAGDIRIQQSGVTYGPESFGPEGCVQLEFFVNRRGMFPHYADMDASMFGFLMEQTGIHPM
jgi:hypothetical protein